jgi:hypothetical protein
MVNAAIPNVCLAVLVQRLKAGVSYGDLCGVAGGIRMHNLDMTKSS